MREIEREREAERLLGLGSRLPAIIRSRACRSHKSRIMLCGVVLCRLALTRRSTAFLAALLSGPMTIIGTFPRNCGTGAAGFGVALLYPYLDCRNSWALRPRGTGYVAWLLGCWTVRHLFCVSDRWPLDYQPSLRPRSGPGTLIPTVLVHDRFGPIPGGDGSDLTWDGAETVPGVAAGINDRLVAVVDAGVEEVVA